VTAHVHTWTPAEGAMARYRCACSAWGRRVRTGEIVAMKAPPMMAPDPTITARPAILGGSISVGNRIDCGRQTRRAPVAR
jgi:hypothetical protein